MAKPRVLIQLDTDAQPSVFDAIVAIDAGVDHLLRHAAVTVDEVQDLVYGGMFTRSPADLKSTAIFVGGSNIAAAEEILAQVRRTFFGPLRISAMFDANGANTTAAAAVLAAARHSQLAGAEHSCWRRPVPSAVAWCGFWPAKGQPFVSARAIWTVAQAVCDAVKKRLPQAKVAPYFVTNEGELRTSLNGAQIVIAAGPPGVRLLPEQVRRDARSLQVAVDLNAVPPLGIEGVESSDRGQSRDGLIAYGAIGVGGLKMKVHKRAIQRLFETNDAILDAEEVFELATKLAD